MTNRRTFILHSCLAGAAWRSISAHAEATLLSESDPQAQALGYHADGRQTDRVRFPQYTPGDQCSGCTLFQTQVGESTGGCPIFGEKRVAATGWCSGFSVAI